jgi:hypothetical protein
MFLLDSLMIAGIRWTLETVVTAAEAELNDDSALRDRLLEAEMQREMGEMTDDEFAAIEADLLQAIREIKERRDGGAALGFGGQPLETGDDTRFAVEAEVTGDFHEEQGSVDSSRSSRSTRSSRSNRSNRSS